MTTPLSNPATGRTPEAEILPLLLERWSPRSFTDEALPPELQERQRPVGHRRNSFSERKTI